MQKTLNEFKNKNKNHADMVLCRALNWYVILLSTVHIFWYQVTIIIGQVILNIMSNKTTAMNMSLEKYL